MSEIARRDAFTRERVDQIRSRLNNEAEKLSAGNACIYATGSYGRCEASEHSDLDIFIVGKTKRTEDENGRKIKKRSLTRLNEILIKGELIKLARALKYPELAIMHLIGPD
jgi:predicted nucleotidyltransferase